MLAIEAAFQFSTRVVLMPAFIVSRVFVKTIVASRNYGCFWPFVLWSITG